MRHLPYRRIALAFGIIAVLVVGLSLAVFAVPQVVGADESYVVVSSSMEPTFGAGDVVLVESVSPASIEEGDIITYYREPTGLIENGQVELVTHRVIEASETEEGRVFRTQGDANDAPDPSVVADAVTGRVTFSIPYLGHLMAFMTTDLGFVTLVGAPLGLLVVGELYDLARAARNTRQGADGTSDTEPQADADESMTQNAPPSGFDPGVSVAGNGAPVDTHDPRAEPTDPTTGSESEGMDDA